MKYSFFVNDAEPLPAEMWSWLVLRRLDACERCGEAVTPSTARALPRDDDPHNTTLENGETVCSSCGWQEQSEEVRSKLARYILS